MRLNFDREMTTSGSRADLGSPVYLASKAFIFMSYWYGGLYVVIEGWRELELRDAQIDRMLESSNVKLLKRYRHGAFHFQRKWLDQRMTEFMAAPDGVSWVRRLSSGLGNYLRAEVKRRSKKGRA